MIYKIKKGHHYSQFKLGFWWNKKSFKWVIKFNESCRYHFNDDDDYDINKLIGVGYLWEESVRFGWIYNYINDNIDIYAYCHLNSVRYSEFITSVKIGEIYNFTIDINADNYLLTSNNITVKVNHNNTRKFQYLSKPFFGGNKTAPHDITIHIG